MKNGTILIYLHQIGEHEKMKLYMYIQKKKNFKIKL